MYTFTEVQNSDGCKTKFLDITSFAVSENTRQNVNTRTLYKVKQIKRCAEVYI